MSPARPKQRAYSSAVAVERAADLLFILAERGEASLTDLASAIGSSGSAAHRILTALKNKGLIVQVVENGPYSISWSILALTQRLVAQADLRSLSLPFMEELRDLTGETVALNVRAGFDRVCIDQLESPHEVSWRQDVGKISPLYGGATGKVILAYLSPEEIETFWRTVTPKKLTPYTTVDRQEMTRELEMIRRRGYAIGRQDRLIGVAGIAAPIVDVASEVAATLTIAGPAERCPLKQLEQWVDPLTSAAQRISRLVADAAIESPAASGMAPQQTGVSGGKRREPQHHAA